MSDPVQSVEEFGEMERTLSQHRCDCSKTSPSIRCRARVCCELVHISKFLRARVAELEAKLEAAEQHVTICQRVNTEEVERRRLAEARIAKAESILGPM